MEPPRDFCELLESFNAHRVLMPGISGTSDEAWQGRIPGDFGGVPAAYIGLPELKRTKRAAGRHKDLADLEALGDTDA